MSLWRPRANTRFLCLVLTFQKKIRALSKKNMHINRARHGVVYDNRNSSRISDFPAFFDDTKLLRSLCLEGSNSTKLHSFFSPANDCYAALVVLDTRLTRQASDLRLGARWLLHILRRSDRMGMTTCNRFYCGVTNDLAERWSERVAPKEEKWRGLILLASGILFNRNCGLKLWTGTFTRGTGTCWVHG